MKLLQKVLALSVIVASACVSSLSAGPTYTSNTTLYTPYSPFTQYWDVYTGGTVTSTISISCTAGAATGANANLTNTYNTTVHSLQVMAYGSSGGTGYGTKTTTGIPTGSYRINHSCAFSGGYGNSAQVSLSTTLSW